MQSTSQDNPTQWLSIRASAGSGKTFALTSRYIYLLFCGARASEILCITFTNKARNEMLERINSTLATLADNSQSIELNPYAKDLITKGISPQAIRTQSKAIYEHFIASNNHIMTFDAFFNMVVKKFSFYAGILSDYEVSACFDVSGEAFRHTLDSLDSGRFKRLVRFCVANDLRANKLIAMIQSLKIDSAEISRAVANPNFKDEIIAEFSALREFVLNLTEGKKGVNLKRLQELRNRFLKKVDSSDIGAILDSLNLTQSMQNTLESLDFDRDFYESKLQNIKSLFKNHFDCVESEILEQISSIYGIYEKRKNSLLRLKNKLNFDDISNICYDLLNHNIDKNFFYFRLDSKINHILIDEFQDTNLRQYEILKPLIDEIKSGVGRIGNRSLFFVGDEKQAIYGFRGCDSRIFRAISDELHLHSESLPKNFRSATNIVGFVNETFAPHFSDFVAQEANSDKRGFVAVVAKSKDDIFPTLRERIQTLLDNHKSDIAILTRKTTTAKEIYEFLKAEFPQVKISVEGESSTNTEYLIILNALRFAQTGNIFYLKNCEKLNGEALSLDATSDKNLKKDATPCQMVHSIIKRFALYGKSALQILEASANFDEVDSLVEFLRSAEIKSSSDSKSAIQIMTIHKSKGLEFGDVIVCEYGGSAHGGDIFYAPNFKGEKIYYMGNAAFRTRRAFADEGFAKILEAKTAQDKIDALNLLYVAFTRTKESLFIIKADKIRGGNALKLGLLDLEETQIGEDIMGESAQIAEIDSAEIPVQSDFGKQGEFINEDSKPYTSKSKIKGLALHKALELHLGFGTPKADIEAILQNRYGLVLDSSEIQATMQNMENILQNVALREILADASAVRCEVAYVDNGLKRIDCLVERGDEAIILDYKSSDLDLEAKKAQVAEYVRYAERYFQSVKGYLCFANGEMLRV